MQHGGLPVQLAMGVYATPPLRLFVLVEPRS
jgi:hypothetical protein